MSDLMNSYLLSPEQLEKIAIFTVPQGRGWELKALFPPHVSDDDREKVLDWMVDYRSKVRNLHPLWDLSFRSFKNGYSLRITPEGCEADVKRTAQHKANVLFDEIVKSYGR
jgi:hypothetical protein